MTEIVFCGNGWLTLVDRIRDRLPDGVSIRVRDHSRPIVEEVRSANVIIPSNAAITAEVIASPPNLVLIQQPAAGIEGVDLSAARARGVPVCNAPGMTSDALAEAALLVMLALVRRMPAAARALQNRVVGEPIGSELRGKTLGIIGLGRSGQRLATVAVALGMKLRSVNSASTKDDLASLFGESDLVSVHCPLTEQTRGLVGEKAISAMKRGSYLINCARGPIVDRTALEGALDSGHLAGYGCDVFWQEPVDPADALLARENVVALPHVGGSTTESFDRLAQLVVDNVQRVLRGEPPEHRLA